MTSTTTPLLLLLDAVLSQTPARIKEARTTVRRMVANTSDDNPALRAAALAPIDTHQSPSLTLYQDVDMILTAFPDDTSVASGHDGSLPLHFAASIGDVQVATRILSQNPAAASTPNTKGKIPLHYAAREGRSDMVAYFLYATPHTARIASKKKKLALHFAAGDGHVEVVRQLLRVYPEGASLPSKKGKIPLHFAARWAHLQIASDLLYVYPQGIRCVDWDGSLPLHDAAREGQLVMSRFLIERYPVGLSIANIRGEIPLFPAVLSGNVDLVILYLQGWSMGGMHILKAVSRDDNIESWGWSMVELCLRGAVENFSGYPLMEGKQPPAVCCTVGRGDYLSSLEASTPFSFSASSKIMDVCCRQRQQEESTSTVAKKSQSVAAAAFLGTPPKKRSVKAGGEDVLEEPLIRSKSPILEVDSSLSKKRQPSCSDCSDGSCRKRSRSEIWNEGDEFTASVRQSRRFIALHAALSCGASLPVIKCVLRHHREQVKEADEDGQYPLHLAVCHPICSSSAVYGDSVDHKGSVSVEDKKEATNTILQDILMAYPEAAFAVDSLGRLPLHLAIASRANVSIIEELVRIHPSSGVDPVKTEDRRFNNRPPIYMATEFDCDMSTTYLLLRGDPSVVSSGP